MLTSSFLPFILIILNVKSIPIKRPRSYFYVIPLGTDGGLEENNLSSYLLTTVNNNNIPNSTYVSLDAGTIRNGIQKAIKQKALSLNTDTEIFFQQQIKAYLISHGHLDHLSGFILNTPDDQSGKFIIGLNQTINIIQNSYFNNQAWPNFGPTGLKQYNYQILNPSSTESVPIVNTDLNVRIFTLCHSCPYLSSAFLISRREQPSASILYLGDTGPDDLEKLIQSDNTSYYPRYLDKLWKSIIPFIINDQLKCIFIEISFPNDHPDNLLFGHLTPNWLLKELNILNNYQSIEKLKIIITHIKPEQGAKRKIIKQLKKGNKQHFNFIFPEQGQAIWI